MARSLLNGKKGPKLISLDRQLPVKLACSGCRSGHQKCDGALPTCSRCNREHKICDYTPSRRGRSHRNLHYEGKRLERSSSSILPPDESADSCQIHDARKDLETVAQRVAPFNASKSAPLLPHSPLGDLVGAEIATYGAEDLVVEQCDQQMPTFYTSEEIMLVKSGHSSSFYSCFWPSHPFLPPYEQLESHLEKSNGTGLATIVNFIGARYCHTPDMSSLHHLQMPAEYPPNGYSVQALLLLSISLHMTNNRFRAQASLDKAVSIALSIGMQERNFATDFGCGVQSTEESWRRTWWELYILDIMFAALNQTSTLRLGNIALEVALPCEEAVYRKGEVVPTSLTLRDFDARFFAEEEIRFSSFSYRIAAARALSKIIMVSENRLSSVPSTREAELEMENLMLHLPNEMQTYVDNEGLIDEVAFDAHMIMNAGTIYLHRPQSILASLNPAYTITCTPINATAPSQSVQHHTKKTVDAANEICNMVSASSSLLSHTPFFTCAVAMQAVVHLGLYRFPDWCSGPALAEQQIRMSVGALRKLSEVWELADIVRKDVKDVARALLERPHNPQPSHSSAGENVVPPLPVLKQGAIADAAPFIFNDILPINDDSWIDEFLGLHPAT